MARLCLTQNRKLFGANLANSLVFGLNLIFKLSFLPDRVLDVLIEVTLKP